MKKNLILCAAFAAIAFAGCSKDENTQLTNTLIPLNVTSGIQTRAFDNTWESGDAIGIYMFDAGTTTITDGASNRRYITSTTTENGTFSPAADQTIYFPVSETRRFDLVAYYPHTTHISADNIYTIDVSTQTSQPAIDLMAAAKVTNKYKGDASVAFVFEHKLVKLDITIKGDGVSISDAELAGTTVKITNQLTTGTYNVVDGGAVNVAAGNATEIPLLTNGLKTEGIVLPTTDTDGMLLTFSVPTFGYTYSWAIKKATQSQYFEAGKKYKYTITIGKQEINVTSSVTNWIPGNGEEGESGDAE